MPDTDIDTLQRAATLDPMQIERTLADLWREYMAEQRQHGGEPAARARLANLVSYCRTNAEAERAVEHVTALNAVRPVRSIVAVAEAEAGGTQEAGAAIKCGLTAGRPVCFEEIGLHTPGESARALPALIEPLTIPDLPVFLWFPGDPPLDDAAMERLLPVADRVLTDSHLFTNTLDRFRQLHGWMERFRGQCVFTEMTWTRLGTWREAVGKLFDPTEARAVLPDVDRVVVTSVHGAGEPSDRGLLMVGWLASRLKWRPVRVERGQPYRAFYESARGTVEVILQEGPATARGYLLGLEIHAGDDAFTVKRVHGDPAGAISTRTRIGGREHRGPAYNPQHWKVYELLCSALEIRTPFTDWEDALAAIAGLQEA